MQQVAEALAGFVQQHVDAAAGADPRVIEAERREAQQTGDTAAMLDLPPQQTLYPPERVTLRFIVDPDGRPVAPVARRRRPAARRQLHQHLLAGDDGVG